MLNEFFKYGSCCNTFINVLSCLFNNMFYLRYFPIDWAEGLIVPLHKKADIDEPSNYRGLTPLSTFGKLFTNIINVRLNLWAEKYRVYIEAQAGFRKKIGTVDTIFTHLLNNN